MTVPRIKVSLCATDGYSGMIKKKILWFETTWVDFEVMMLQRSGKQTVKRQFQGLGPGGHGEILVGGHRL